jgi:hypothetical protein
LVGDQKSSGYGEENLKRSSCKDESFDPNEVLQGELNADGKEEQNNADLSQDFHLFLGADQAESMRARQNSGDQETHDGRHTESMTQKKDPDSKGEDQQDVFQNGYFHG